MKTQTPKWTSFCTRSAFRTIKLITILKIRRKSYMEHTQLMIKVHSNINSYRNMKHARSKAESQNKLRQRF